MPAYAGIAILFGIAIPRLFQYIGRIPLEKKSLGRIYIYVISMIQFVVLVYNPLKQIPTQIDLKAGQGFITKLAQFKGDLLLPRHGYLPTLAGTRSFAHEMAIHDNLTGGRKEVSTKLRHEIQQAIAQKKFRAIILDDDWYFLDDVKTYYTQQENVFEDGTVFWPVTGYKTRPEYIYIPKED